MSGTATTRYHYCCERLQQLGNAGYIDGSILYLQHVDVNTNLPAHLRNYIYCISCGQDNFEHSKDVSGCLTLRNGTMNGCFRRTGNEFAFNLNTTEERNKGFQVGDENFPSTLELKYCPYCSVGYIPPTITFEQ